MCTRDIILNVSIVDSPLLVWPTILTNTSVVTITTTINNNNYYFYASIIFGLQM